MAFLFFEATVDPIGSDQLRSGLTPSPSVVLGGLELVERQIQAGGVEGLRLVFKSSPRGGYMHIPDGYLGPQTYVPLYGVSVGFWAIAQSKLKKQLSLKHVPYLAMAAAFSFLIQMFNIPIPGGTTGHAVGAGVIAILLGPWTAVLAVSVVLIIQAVVFGDGGITAIGANCFNMAVVMPFVSYGVFKLIKGKSQAGARLAASAFLSGYLGLLLAALFAAVELGIQPLIATGADGRPLYAPYPLSVAIPVMAIEHLFPFGIIEGLVTMLLLKYFLKHERDLVYALSGPSKTG